MYQQHFGLDRQPFKITPDTSLFFSGNKRGAALEALVYAIKSGEGIVKVVGEVGSGKTMLCRMLELRLKEDAVDVVYIANPSLSPDIILHMIADELQLGVNDATSKFAVMQKIQTYLLKKYSNNQRVVLFVEEAQSMPVETLEEIRLLSNLETDQDKLLQMVLFGQPELDDKLSQVNIRQLKERITHSFYLAPFEPDDTREYLNFRLRAVGYRGPDLFNKKISARVKKYSGGLTRRINILADKALLAAYSDGGHNITTAHIKSAAIDSEFVSKTLQKKLFRLIVIGAVLLAALVSAVLMGLSQQHKKPDQVVAPVKNISRLQQNSHLPVLKQTAVKPSPYKVAKFNRGLITARLQATRLWLSKVNTNNYSIQLFTTPVSDRVAIDSFLHKAGSLLDISKIYIYETRVKGRFWYSVLYADFGSQRDARKMIKTMPASIQKRSPYLRRINAIKKDLKAGMKYLKKDQIEQHEMERK